MAALGIGDALVLHEADAVLPDLTRFDLEKFVVKKRVEKLAAKT